MFLRPMVFEICNFIVTILACRVSRVQGMLPWRRRGRVPPVNASDPSNEDIKTMHTRNALRDDEEEEEEEDVYLNGYEGDDEGVEEVDAEQRLRAP